MPADVFTPVVASLGIATFFVVFNERVVEWLFAPLFAKERLQQYSGALRYIALLSGIGLVGFLFPIDLISPMLEPFGIVSPVPSAGVWVTALAVGTGSSLFHELFIAS